MTCISRISWAIALAVVSVACTSVDADIVVDGSFEVEGANGGGLDSAWSGTGSLKNTGVVGAKDGSWRAAVGNLSEDITQTTSHVIAVGDTFVLDFFVNAANGTSGRGFIGTLFGEVGGVRTNLASANASISAFSDTSAATWEQANSAELAYVVLAGDASVGSTLGVSFFGTTAGASTGLDLVSLEVSSIPEPGSTMLIGSLSVALLCRRRRV